MAARWLRAHRHLRASTKMRLLSRSWESKRKAISSNAELRALVESEDASFHLRLLRRELRGTLIAQGGREDDGWRGHRICEGRLQVWHDSITMHESPTLGLSNMRAALQAFQVLETWVECLRL